MPSVDAARVATTLAVHVVAHTHWDREWYHPAVRFQARLVALIDALLAASDAATPFLLDGQMIVLEDYLAVRPERGADLVRALGSGALEAGPWYVLADNLIPSGEAIVRNLEAGRRWLRRLGATPPRVAYCPDTFGHPAAIPTIAAGFGCEAAIVWRGFGGASFPATDTAWWHGPDDERVLLYHLPPDGYEFGSALPVDADAAADRWRVIGATLRARNHTGTVLLTSGADHHAAAPDLTRALERLDDAARADGSRAMRSGLWRAAGELLQAAGRYERASGSLPAVRGELRDSYGYTWTLPGTLATRAHSKRANARLERMLVRDVEPWTALAWLHAEVPSTRGVAPDGSLTLAQFPVLVQHAWQVLLQTHPHDTLCGCATDDVARDMAARQRRARALCVELREAALCAALGHDRVTARGRSVNRAPLTVLRNRSSRTRSGIAVVRLLETLGDVPVGPGSAGATTPKVPERADRPPLGDFLMQPIATRVRHQRRESPQHYPDNDLVREHRVLAWVPDVPAFGARVVNAQDTAVHSAPHPVSVHEARGHVEIDNGRLRIVASREGLTIIDGARRLENALRLETIADAGDSYTPSLRGAPESLRLHAVRAGAPGPLRGSVVLSWRWRRGRERLRVRTEIILDAGASHVRCDVRGWNGRRDHRLQLVWQTDVHAPHVTADAAFGPVGRAPIRAPAAATPFEIPPSTMPLHRWLAAHNATHGATLISDGLAEGEVHDGRLAVTLLRAIGHLSKPDLPERPGHAGWPCDIPAAQVQGAFAARLGLYLHGPWSGQTLFDIEDASDALLLPLTGESWRDLDGASRVLAGPLLEGDGLVASAVHLRDDDEAIVLRAVNLASRMTSGRWTLPSLAAWECRRVRLDGTPIDDWSPTDSVMAFDAGPRAVVTFEVRRALDSHRQTA